VARFTVEELPDPDRSLDLIGHNVNDRFSRESSEPGGRTIHRERQDQPTDRNWVDERRSR
jgi:hypothetical protein